MCVCVCIPPMCMFVLTMCIYKHTNTCNMHGAHTCTNTRMCNARTCMYIAHYEITENAYVKPEKLALRMSGQVLLMPDHTSNHANFKFRNVSPATFRSTLYIIGSVPFQHIMKSLSRGGNNSWSLDIFRTIFLRCLVKFQHIYTIM